VDSDQESFALTSLGPRVRWQEQSGAPSVSFAQRAAQWAREPLRPRFPLPREFLGYLREPLAQRPAGSVGKAGVCALSFGVRQGKTHLLQSFVSHPFHLTSPWRLDAALPGMAVAYLQTPAGGLIQGDRARMHCALSSRAQVHLTTQAAEKIHSMTSNCAVQQLTLSLSADAYAEYCPEPVILFPGARFAQELDVALDEGAACFLSEIFFFRQAEEATTFDALTSTVRVRSRATGVLLYDRTIVFPRKHALTGPGVLGPYRAWGVAAFVGPAVPQDWVRAVYERVASETAVLCGVTALHQEQGVYLKAVGREAQAVRWVLHGAWDVLRTRFLGAPASLYPK
jgi:urease accessory protein